MAAHLAEEALAELIPTSRSCHAPSLSNLESDGGKIGRAAKSKEA